MRLINLSYTAFDRKRLPFIIPEDNYGIACTNWSRYNVKKRISWNPTENALEFLSLCLYLRLIMMKYEKTQQGPKHNFLWCFHGDVELFVVKVCLITRALISNSFPYMYMFVRAWYRSIFRIIQIFFLKVRRWNHLQGN